MLLGPVVGADTQEWDRMIAINVQGLLYTTRAALPHLLQAAEQGPRRVADIVNISSIAGRLASNGYGVYSFTKFGVRGFTESLRQEVTQRHVRVGVLEPGGVATELGSHNKPEVRNQMIDPFYQQTEVLAPEDIADGVVYMVTRPATPPSASCGSCPPNSSDRIRCPRLRRARRSSCQPGPPAVAAHRARLPARRPRPACRIRPRRTQQVHTALLSPTCPWTPSRLSPCSRWDGVPPAGGGDLLSTTPTGEHVASDPDGLLARLRPPAPR
jgi:short chain dehydrogenase